MSKKIIWTAEKYQRLLAATIAAHPDIKINYNNVAAMFGEGATYDSIETRFRNIKKDAKKLQEEIASGTRPASSAPTPKKRKADTSNAPSTPRKARMSRKPIIPAEDIEMPVKQEGSIDDQGFERVEWTSGD